MSARWTGCALAVGLAACGENPKQAETRWQDVRSQFVADQLQANKHFKGTEVEWTATVSSTLQHQEMPDGVLALLNPEAGSKSTTFLAWFPHNMVKEVFKLRPGQEVTVHCRIDHISTKFQEVAISLEGCRLAKVWPLPATASSDTFTQQTVQIPDGRKP